MGLSEEFGLFERKKNIGLISGRPKRGLGFLTRPIKKEFKKELGQRAKGFFKGTKPISVESALELERKAILKGKTGKARRRALKSLGEI